MEINDLLKVPQLFAVKKDGILQIAAGLGDEVFAVKAGYMFRVHSIMGCGSPDCDCIDKAFTWAKLNKNAVADGRLCSDDSAYFMGMGHGAWHPTKH